MKKVGILIDSTSTFDEKEVKSQDIHLIYNSVNDDDGNVIEDICSDEQKRQICDLIAKERRTMRTSSVNSQIIQDKINELLKKYEYVVYITLAPTFSGQYNNALAAKACIGNKNVIILHSGSVAVQTEIVLNSIMKYINDGNEMDQDKMQNHIFELSKHITTILTTFHLEGLIASGRIPTPVAKLLKLAKMHPIIQGEETHKKAGLYRKWTESTKNVLEAIDNRFPKPPRGKDIKEVYLCQSLCEPERIEELLTKIAEHFQIDKKIIKVRVTPLLVLSATLKDSFGVTVCCAEDIVKK